MLRQCLVVDSGGHQQVLDELTEPARLAAGRLQQAERTLVGGGEFGPCDRVEGTDDARQWCTKLMGDDRHEVRLQLGEFLHPPACFGCLFKPAQVGEDQRRRCCQRGEHVDVVIGEWRSICPVGDHHHADGAVFDLQRDGNGVLNSKFIEQVVGAAFLVLAESAGLTGDEGLFDVAASPKWQDVAGHVQCVSRRPNRADHLQSGPIAVVEQNDADVRFEVRGDLADQFGKHTGQRVAGGEGSGHLVQAFEVSLPGLEPALLADAVADLPSEFVRDGGGGNRNDDQGDAGNDDVFGVWGRSEGALGNHVGGHEHGCGDQGNHPVRESGHEGDDSEIPDEDEGRQGRDGGHDAHRRSDGYHAEQEEKIAGPPSQRHLPVREPERGQYGGDCRKRRPDADVRQHFHAPCGEQEADQHQPSGPQRQRDDPGPRRRHRRPGGALRADCRGAHGGQSNLRAMFDPASWSAP